MEFSAPSAIVEDNKGFLHSEVGIDKELEKLLAEDPGLYMEDNSNISDRSHYSLNSGPVSSPSIHSNSSQNPKR